MNERSRAASTVRIDLAHEPDFVLGCVEIRPSRREIVGRERRDTIEPRVMRTLVALARANGEILSRDDLIESCWDGVIVGEDAINRCISQVRKAAEASGNAFSIETVPRVGYRLKVTDVPAATVAPSDVQTSAAPEPYIEPESGTGVPAPESAQAVAVTSSGTGGGFADAVSSFVSGAEARPVFNHDLLIDPADIRSVRQAFPAMSEFLDWPKLREAFTEHERQANKAKSLSRRSGLAAIAIGLTALWAAVLIPGFHDFLPRTLTARISLMVAAILAAAVLFFATRSLMAAARESWLHHRAATERLRQLHFQFLVRRAGQIATQSGGTNSPVMRERAHALELLSRDLTPGNTKPAVAIMGDSGCASCWLVDRSPEQTPLVRSASLAELFRAYARLRFQHQADYATKKLAPRANLWTGQPRGEARGIATLSHVLILIVVVSELSVLFLIVLGGAEIVGFGPTLQTIATLAALGALALFVAGDGIRPRSELIRLRNYRGEVQELFRKFESAIEPSEKLSLMERMEETSYRELRDFLMLQNSEHNFL